MNARLVIAAVLALGGLAGVAAGTAPRGDARDADGDGYPDVAELTSDDDRAAFVESLVAVALAQAPEPEPAFDPSQRDCAGLVRFAYREALKRHDARFAARHPGLARLPEVRAFRYPEVPVVGTRLFRVQPGPFRPGRTVDDFAEAPDALRLGLDSASPVRGRPQPGDLALFRTASGGAHLMILATDEADPLVVYHTGPKDGGPGEVRRARLSSLFAHPDPQWRPTPVNPSFVGWRRFKILEGR